MHQHPNHHHFVFSEPDFHLELKILCSDCHKFSLHSNFGVNNMVQISFDATQVKPLVEYTTLPEGQYLVEITQSLYKQTKAGDGNYLEFEYTVLDGELKGSLYWDRLCLEHPSPKATKRANAALSAICHAIGVMTFHDTIELHHLPFVITIKNKINSEGNSSAEIAGYAPRPSFAAAPVTPEAARPAQPGTSPPWAR
jgi:hypothetical protein